MVYVSRSISPHYTPSPSNNAALLQKIAIIAAIAILTIGLIFLTKHFLFRSSENSSSGQASKNKTDYDALVRKGHFDEIKKAVNDGLIDVNNTDYLDNALDRSDKIANLFAKKVDNPDVKPHFYSDTFIVKAAEKGYKQTVLTLVERGADTKEKLSDDKTLIMCAVKKGWDDVVLAMVEKDTNYLKSSKLLKTAIHHQRDELAAKLIEKNIECPADVHNWLSDSKSPMAKAKEAVAKRKIPRLIKFIIQSGLLSTIDLNKLDQEEKDSYLSASIELENCKAARTCIEKGANPNIKCNSRLHGILFDYSKYPSAVALALKYDDERLLSACINQTTFANPCKLKDVFVYACQERSYGLSTIPASVKCASIVFNALSVQKQLDQLSPGSIKAYISLMQANGKSEELETQLKVLSKTQLASLIQGDYEQEATYQLIERCDAKHTPQSLAHLIQKGFYDSASACILASDFDLTNAAATAVIKGWVPGLKTMKGKGFQFTDTAFLDAAVVNSQLDAAKFLAAELGTALTQGKKGACLTNAKTVSMQEWLLNIGAAHSKESLKALFDRGLENADLFEVWKRQILSYTEKNGSLELTDYMQSAISNYHYEAVKFIVEKLHFKSEGTKERQLKNGKIYQFNSLDYALIFSAHWPGESKPFSNIIQYFCERKIVPLNFPRADEALGYLITSVDKSSDRNYQAQIITILIEKAEAKHQSWLTDDLNLKNLRSIYQKCNSTVASQKVHNFFSQHPSNSHEATSQSQNKGNSSSTQEARTPYLEENNAIADEDPNSCVSQ